MDWLSTSNPVAWWWGLLSTCAAFNVTALAFIVRRTEARTVTPEERRRIRTVLVLAALFTIGCASRSFIPRVDVERYVIWDLWFSNVFVGRSIATVAELAFGLEGAVVLFFVSKALGFTPGMVIARLVPVMLFTAECFSWYAVITTHFFGNVIEESLWAASYALAGVALLGISFRAKGRLKTVAVIGAIAAVLFVAFMVTHDVPMYVSRLAADSAAGRSYLDVSSGVHDLLNRWVVTRSFEHWGPEMPWMTLYFTFAVWVSLALCFAPLTTSDVQRLQTGLQ